MLDPIAVTVIQAMAITGMSRTYIYEALKRGDLKARRAGRRVLIPVADLADFIESLPPR